MSNIYRKKLTLKQAIAAEKEMRRLEKDPKVSKKELRLFMQSLMPCGHIAANLLTCPDPPYGCIACIKLNRCKKEHMSNILCEFCGTSKELVRIKRRGRFQTVLKCPHMPHCMYEHEDKIQKDIEKLIRSKGAQHVMDR